VNEDRKLTTRVKARTLNPVWNEKFTFLVRSFQHQKLHATLYDSDILRSDDKIGRYGVLNVRCSCDGGRWQQLPMPVHFGCTRRWKARHRTACATSGGMGILRVTPWPLHMDAEWSFPSPLWALSPVGPSTCGSLSLEWPTKRRADSVCTQRGGRALFLRGRRSGRQAQFRRWGRQHLHLHLLA
jgi:hypothetical protein